MRCTVLATCFVEGTLRKAGEEIDVEVLDPAFVGVYLQPHEPVASDPPKKRKKE